jgi:hypothetical protein
MSKATLKDAIRITIGALLLTAGIAYAGTWTAPSQTFPNGNVDAPINVGSTMQTKTGGIWASAFATLGGGYFGGGLLVGPTTGAFNVSVGAPANIPGAHLASTVPTTVTFGGSAAVIYNAVRSTTYPTLYNDEYLTFNTHQGGVTVGERMRIDPSGNVGIGTPTPGTNKLEVVGGPIKATGGLIIETRTSDPASPATGQMWLRTDL